MLLSTGPLTHPPQAEELRRAGKEIIFTNGACARIFASSTGTD